MKIHLVDGKKYVEVAGPAKVGDKVLIVNARASYDKYFNGNIIEVKRLSEDPMGIENDAVSTCGNAEGFISAEEYVVIEPLKPTLSELCAKCTPENRHEEVFVDTSQASPDVLDMLANLARRVTSLESQIRDTQRNAEWLAEELMSLKYLTQSNEGDIRMIDQRTQIIDAINKYYAEGSR
jgi:hypothetical protein